MILSGHRQGPAGDKYISVQSMVDYEVSNKVIEKSVPKKGLPNGCRSLLRLNRALEFIMGFLEILQNTNSDVPLTTAVHNCYKATLAKHHAWIIQKGVNLALYTLPTKENLIRMLSEGEGEGEFSSKACVMVDKLKVVYGSVHRCYEANNIQDLP